MGPLAFPSALSARVQFRRWKGDRCMGLPGPEPATVGDLVEAAEVRPVVRLADLADPGLRAGLRATFLAGPALSRRLEALRRAVASGRGQTLLVEGPYGSGKSHLLAALGAWAAGEPVRALPPVPRPPLAVAAVSLIEHAGGEPIEGAVRAALAAATGRALSGSATLPRREAFARFAAGRTGFLILLDELSEFLRSKPTPATLAEDVRFLQYLAEWAPSAPAWIVAAINEPLAAGVSLGADLRRRLLDRYPARLRLDEAHLADLVAHRLRRLRPGAGAWLNQRYADLRRAFGSLPFPAEAFIRLYPFHPATIAWLHDLRGLLSEQRGAVDFVYHQLRGDPTRDIPPGLAAPAGELICPDALFDHFADRLRESPETEPLATVVLPGLAGAGRQLFADAEERAVALRLVKLLVLAAGSAPPRRLGPRECAGMLLHRLTDVAPDLNRTFVAGLLARMAQANAFVAALPAAGAEEPAYRLDPHLDAGLHLRRRLVEAGAAVARDPSAAWSHLLVWWDEPGLPLSRACAAGGFAQEMAWRGSRRVLRWLLASPADQDDAEVRALLLALGSAEVDAAVVVAPVAPGEPARSRGAWRGRWRTLRAGTAPQALTYCWVPRAPRPEEREVLNEGAAWASLQPTLPEGALRDALLAGLPAVKERVGEVLRALYDEGEVMGPDGRTTGEKAPLGQRMALVCAAALSRRFPRHPELRLPATQGGLLRALHHLCREGVCEDGRAGTRALADAYAPFGLVARTAGDGLRLRLEPAAAPVLGEVQAVLAGASPHLPVPAADLYARLRSGRYGLQRRAFEAVALLLVGAGTADLCRRGRRVHSERLNAAAIWEADGLVPGELLAPGPAATLRQLPWLPERLRTGTLTQFTQREAWEAVRRWQAEQAELAASCAARLREAAGLPALRNLGETAAGDLDRLDSLFRAGSGLAPCEGLTRFLFAWGAEGDAAALVARCRSLHAFLTSGLDRFLWAVAYVQGAAAALPAGHPLGEEAVRLHGELSAGPGEWAAVLERVARFRAAYADLYHAAHGAAAGEAAFAPYRGVAASPGATVARVLSGLPLLESALPWADVDADLAAAQRAACRVSDAELAERLRRLPVCTCGFRPAAPPPPLPEPEAMAERAERSARGYLQGLTRPAAVQRLRAYTAGLRVVARNAEADQLERFVATAAEASLSEAAATLRGPVGERLREALLGQVVVVDRTPEDLLHRLRGRVLTVPAVQGALAAWLGPVPRGAYVRVRAGLPEGRGGDWRAALAAGVPDLASARSVIDALWDGEADAAAVYGSPTPAGRLCTLAARVVRGLQAARAVVPSTPADWEALWAGPASRSELHLARLRTEAAAAGQLPLPALDAWEAQWSEVRDTLQTAWQRARTEGMTGRGDLGGLWSRLSGNLWWIDALRQDLADDLADAAREFAEVSERGLLWARVPTDTATQLAALRDAGCTEPVVRWTGDVGAAAGRILRWPFLDDRIHGSVEAYGDLAEAFREMVGRHLLPALAALAPGAEVWLFGDHGFRANPAFRPSDPHAAPRYAHGGDSPDEVLVPWLLLRRKA